MSVSEFELLEGEGESGSEQEKSFFRSAHIINSYFLQGVDLQK